MIELDSTTKYFDRIGGIDLLDREQEIDLARRIAIGVDAARTVLTMVSREGEGTNDSAGDQAAPSETIANQSYGALFADALAHGDDVAASEELRQLILDGASARELFIMANLRLAISGASRYRNSGFPTDDLVQFATEGVIAAVDTYDYKKARFSTHAVGKIRFALTRNIDNLSRLVRIPVDVATEVRKLNRTIRELSTDHADLPVISEIAHHMETSVERVEELLKIRMSVASLDIPDEYDRGTVGDLLPDTRFPSPEEQVVDVDDFELVKILLDELEKIDPKGAEVIRAKFGIGIGSPMSHKQIARQYHIAPRRINLIHEQAMTKLKEIVAAQNSLN